jgi:DNA-binding CsgD family transcriptional regulator
MKAAREVGFEFGSASYFPRRIRVADAVFVNSMPGGWLAHYAQEGHEHHSPIMQRRDAVSAFTWRMSDWDGRLDRPQRRWRDDNLAAGIAHGFNIPDRADGESKIISLSGAGEAAHPHDLMTLQFAGFEFFARVRELAMPSAPKTAASLSNREAECLTWVASGKSDWEIGEILGLSQKTVNHHVERAKAKLQSASRIQAVVVALRSAMIHI